MAGVHQLKKLAQTRAIAGGNTGRSTWIDYMPKHWSAYTCMFSAASLIVFCFFLYDAPSSPTSLLRNAGRELGVALKAQVGDLRNRSPSKEVIVNGGKPIGSEGSVTNQEQETDSRVLEEAAVDELEGSTGVDVDSSKLHDPKVNGSHSINEKEKGRKKKKVVDAAVTGEEDFDSSTESKEVVKEESLEEMINVDPEGLQQMDDVTVAGNLVEEISEFDDLDKSCDFSKGQWVYDENYPLYKPNTCPFIDGGFRCVENGRPSDEFQKYRWQPTGCSLPRFNAKAMLERLRGGRLVFVGDSIGRNNWESMMCMLSEAVENKSRIYEINGEPITKHTGFLSFRFEDFDCTVEYYRSPYLVPQGRAPPRSDPRVRSTLKLDIMDWSSSKWRDADVVIFNSGHWWSFEKTVRSGNYFQQGINVPLNMSVGEAFQLAMRTVAQYVEKNMDSTKSQVLFRSYAPVHFKGGTWETGGTCNGDTKPLEKFPFVYEDRTPNNMILDEMKAGPNNPVGFVNITYLSDLRPDGHSSIWQRVPPSPKNHQDCSHWCLPGVPDTWNELIFAKLLQDGKGRWASQDTH